MVVSRATANAVPTPLPHGNRYPLIPAMSAEAERVFLSARRQIPWCRANLAAKTIKQMECLKHWQRKGWINELNVDLPLEEGEAEAECEVEIDSEG
jgi:hypothetical protein